MRAVAPRVHAPSRSPVTALAAALVVASMFVSTPASAAPPLGGVAGAGATRGSHDHRDDLIDATTLGTLAAGRSLVMPSLVAPLDGGLGVGGGAWASRGPAEAPAGGPASSEGTTTAEPGDLRGALEAARAQRKAAPGPDGAMAEAGACEALGDYACAKAALQAVIEDPSATQAQRTEAESWLADLDEESRGRNTDPTAPEPDSTHRASIDAERDARLAALNPPPPPPVEPAKDKPERIVRKWYFWVTVAAIGAAAGAITGIAVSAAAEERRDSLDASAGAGTASSMGPALLRF